MERTRLIQALARQGKYCEGRSPLYAGVLTALAAHARESPAWLEALGQAWQQRHFAVDWEAAHLLLAAMHYWALRGAADELAAVYPSCGGGAGDPGAAAKRFLVRAPPAFWERLRSAHVQTNEVDRSVAWMIAGAAAFGAQALPFHLVEIGASAGLNLVGDHLPHECRFVSEAGNPAVSPSRWEIGAEQVLTRTGLDISPRNLADPADRLWLKACVWADDLARLERLERAIDVFLQLQKLPSGPRLERCTFSEAPDWLQAHRPPAASTGLLVFNSIATIYLDEHAYQSLRHAMGRALAPWNGRALWVEYERARGAADGPLELSIHRVFDGHLRTRVLASGAPRPQEIRLRSGWEFCTA